VWSNVVFGGCFVACLLVFVRILAPLVLPVLMGGFLVVLALPLHDAVLARLGERPALAAALSTALVFLLILLPVGALGWLIGKELLDVAASAQAVLERTNVSERLLAHLPESVRASVSQVARDDGPSWTQALGGGAAMVGALVGAGASLALNVFLMLVSMYYFFLDGRRLIAEAFRLLPLDPGYPKQWAQEFKDVAYALMYGNSLTALIQGGVGLLGLWLAGVPHALVWGAAMAATALIPVGGTALVWGPIGVALVVVGRTTEGLFLLCWGAFVVSTLDNVLRPRLCGARMRVHPLLVFLSMFGGLGAFGMAGLLLGPLVTSLFMSMIRIYRRDYLPEARAPLAEVPKAA
jgi:predicted PurR-regulated permease PerM